MILKRRIYYICNPALLSKDVDFPTFPVYLSVNNHEPVALAQYHGCVHLWFGDVSWPTNSGSVSYQFWFRAKPGFWGQVASLFGISNPHGTLICESVSARSGGGGDTWPLAAFDVGSPLLDTLLPSLPSLLDLLLNTCLSPTSCQHAIGLLDSLILRSQSTFGDNALSLYRPISSWLNAQLSKNPEFYTIEQRLMLFLVSVVIHGNTPAQQRGGASTKHCLSSAARYCGAHLRNLLDPAWHLSSSVVSLIDSLLLEALPADTTLCCLLVVLSHMPKPVSIPSFLRSSHGRQSVMPSPEHLPTMIELVQSAPAVALLNAVPTGWSTVAPFLLQSCISLRNVLNVATVNEECFSLALAHIKTFLQPQNSGEFLVAFRMTATYFDNLTPDWFQLAKSPPDVRLLRLLVDTMSESNSLLNCLTPEILSLACQRLQRASVSAQSSVESIFVSWIRAILSSVQPTVVLKHFLSCAEFSKMLFELPLKERQHFFVTLVERIILTNDGSLTLAQCTAATMQIADCLRRCLSNDACFKECLSKLQHSLQALPLLHSRASFLACLGDVAHDSNCPKEMRSSMLTVCTKVIPGMFKEVPTVDKAGELVESLACSKYVSRQL